MNANRWLTLIATISFCGLLIAATPSPLTQRYINVLSSNASQQAQLDVLNQLQWSGLSDPRLYDLIEQKLLELYPDARGDEVDLASWYAKSLGTSGLAKYVTTLQAIIDSDARSKIKKYAREGIDNVVKYTHWNPIIADREGLDPDKPERTNGFVNMLRSDQWALKNMAAKRIYSDKVYDPYLLDVLYGQIMALYETDHQGDLQIQTVAWMCRALASSRVPRYQSTLEEVAANAGSSKVRSYAKKYLKQNY